MKYYSAKTVTQILGVTAQTLRNWDKGNKLKPSYVKSNGYRYYSEESILAYTQERKTKKEKKALLYLKNENETYIKVLNEMLSKYSLSETIVDDDRSFQLTEKLKNIISMINKKEIDVLIISTPDVLNFHYEAIEYFAKLNNVKIEVIDKKVLNELLTSSI